MIDMSLLTSRVDVNPVTGTKTPNRLFVTFLFQLINRVADNSFN